jgi:malate/lactate dehydrogenase
MDLELACVSDIVEELQKRDHCPFILVYVNPVNLMHEVHWSEKCFPNVMNVMYELNFCQAQFLEFLHARWEAERGDHGPDDE